MGPYDYLLDKTENDFRLYAKEKNEKGNVGTDWRIEDFKENLKKEKKKKKGLPDFHQNLSFGSSAFQIIHRFIGFIERKNFVDDRFYFTFFDDACDFFQLFSA